MRSPRAVLLALAVLAPACADTAILTDEVEADDLGKADLTAELRVRTGETTIWVDRTIGLRERDGRTEWVLEGRASRTITDGMGFVFDDPVGDFATRSARGFEVVYPASDRGLMEGVQHFVRLGFTPSAGRPDGLTARIVVQPTLTDFDGYGLWIDGPARPVVSGGRTMWRVSARTTGAIDAMWARIGTVEAGEVRALDATHFVVDLTDVEVAALVAGERLALEAATTLGRRRKSGAMVLAVARLGATSGDAYEVWPPPVCEDAVRACLAALPDGTTDLGGCGEAIAVKACGGTNFVFDDVAFGAAMDRADAVVAAGLALDADALVGSDKQAGFLFGVRETIQERFQGLFGQRFASAAARDAAADALATQVIDRVYARPLELVDEPHAPAAGNLAATRQLVADHLLAHLAGLDLGATEFGRPLEELTRQFRARHVADLRAFRTAVAPLDTATQRVFVGNWLDPHVEITVARATGQVTGILFEID